MDKRSRLTRVAGAAASAVALVVAVGAGSARAADPAVVSVLRCADDGSVTVPSGAPIRLHLGGYAGGTLGLTNAVLSAQTTTLEVAGPAGDTTYDLSGQWSAPVNTGLGFWLITQPDRTIAPLAAGQTATVTYDISFSHPVAVLFEPVGPSGNNGPFVITEEGPAVCQIAAA
jgi:hypothetical protein